MNITADGLAVLENDEKLSTCKRSSRFQSTYFVHQYNQIETGRNDSGFGAEASGLWGGIMEWVQKAKSKGVNGLTDHPSRGSGRTVKLYFLVV